MKKSFFKSLKLGALALLLSPLASTLTEVQEVAAQDEAVVLYTNSLDDPKQAWLEEKVAEAGFNVEYVIAGGGEIFDRLMAEKNDIQADVVIGMDEGSFSQLVENDMLIEWEPTWKDQIPAELIYGDGFYYPWAEQRIFAFFDPNRIDAEEVPGTLEELGQTEALQGQYIVPHELGGSTNQKIVFSILLQHLDENGEYGVSEEGWQAAGDFLKNGYMPSEDENKHALLADGTVSISFHFSGGIPNAEKEFGFTAEPINPPYGVFTMSEQVGIMNKGEDHDYTAATEFAEWWGSEEIQRGWVEAFGTVPANENVKDSTDERVLELYDQTDRMDVDWDALNEHLSDWVEKIELELMPF